jgi:hypothetical protein
LKMGQTRFQRMIKIIVIIIIIINHHDVRL